MPSLFPVERGHAADACFEQLAREILAGGFLPNTTLPPERDLAERFGVSRVIVRQAIHRLADLGLVRVRQGGGTRVADPETVTDLRVLELRIRLGPQSPADAEQLIEAQLLRAHTLLVLAEMHASPDARRALASIIEEYAARGGGENERAEFERRFWSALAKAGGNGLCVLETAWWYRVLDAHPEALHPPLAPPAARVTFYREIGRRLVEGDEPARFYLEMTRTALQARARRKKP